MAGQELTRDEVFALAGAFGVDRAKALLSLARFPSWAVPERDYANAREFWAKVSAELAAGVMPDGRPQILAAARDWYPGNARLAALAAAAALPSPPPAPAAGPDVISVAGGQGFQIGNDNVQINLADYGGAPGREAPQADPPVVPSAAAAHARALRLLVIGASPIDADLPHIRADREAHAIERVVAPDRVDLTVVLGAEATDVRRVGTFRPDIVHFVCHGTANKLVFSDAGGESHYVAADKVARSLRLYRDDQGVRLRGIVLAACDGEALAPIFGGVADTVIAHRGKLADQCGVAFAEQFYTLLNARTARGRAVVPDLAGIAREAAQLTAQSSAACDPVLASLIVRQDGG